MNASEKRKENVIKRSHASSAHESKVSVVLQGLDENFPSFLHTLMVHGGFDKENEAKINGIQFLYCLKFSLLSMAKELREMKSKLSQESTMKERDILRNLLAGHHDIQETDIKLKNTIQLFEMNFHQSLRNLMIQADFVEQEINQNNDSYVDSYVDIYSKCFQSLYYSYHQYTDMKFNNDATANNQASSQTNFRIESSSNSSSSLRVLSESIPTRLLLANKVYSLYHVSYSTSNFVMKVLNPASNLVKGADSLDNEMKYSNATSHPAIRCGLERTRFQGKEALLLEWVNGVPISKIGKVNVKDFFVIAREIVSAILSIHERGLMHSNISCDHVMVDLASTTVKIISFSSATSTSCHIDCISDENFLKKDLRCIAPEQIGRVKRMIDYRADFYSIGIVFYKLISGVYPFDENETLKLMKMHLNDSPKPVHLFDSGIPLPISLLISKLIEKKAEDRYQTAKGIMYDIESMISEYSSDETLSAVEICKHDKNDELFLPHSLYGRSSEVSFMKSMIMNDSPQNSLDIIFIEGKAGCGKSSIVCELFPYVLRRDGLSLYGKFDKDKQEPYYALREALNGFCNDILLDNENNILNVKAQIKEAIGDEGKLLTDLAPQFFHIIGEQPFLSESFGAEAKNRLNYLLIKLIKAIASQKFLVLTLEDIQWLDVDSKNFLIALAQEKSIKNMIIIFTSRPDSSTEDFMKHFEKAKANLTTIHLRNLGLEEVDEIVSKALNTSNFEMLSFSTYILKKTSGNPFYVTQMIKTLHDLGDLFFCPNQSLWRFKTTSFDSNNLEKDVLHLLRRKILCLKKNVQIAFRVACCLGSPFSIKVLRIILEDNKAVDEAMATGMLRGLEPMYRFSHDEIQTAVISLLPPDPRELFLYIALKLARNLSKDELNEHIFTIANLLHRSFVIVSEQCKRYEMAELLLQAGIEGKRLAAFELAYKYLSIALELLSYDCWTTHYDFTLKLINHTAYAAYSAEKYKSMGALLDKVFKSVALANDLIDSYSLKIRYLNDIYLCNDAVKAGIHILSLLNSEIDLNDCNEFSVRKEILMSKGLLCNMSAEKVMMMDEMTDENSISYMAICTAILQSAHICNRLLFALVTSHMIQITIEKGISKYSSYAICCFGTLLRSKGDDYGYELGKLALLLAGKFNEKEILPKVYVKFYVQISPFYASIHSIFDPLLKAFRISQDIGVKEDSTHIAQIYCVFSFLSGKNLAELMNEIEEFKDIIPSSSYSLIFFAVLQATLNHCGRGNKSPALLRGDALDFSSLFRKDIENHVVLRPLIICGVNACLFNDNDSACMFFEKCRPFEKMIMPTNLYPFLIFYEGLVMLASAESTKGEEKQDILIKAKESISKLENFSAAAPINYLNKKYILETQLSLLLGDFMKAEEFHNLAISHSQKNNFKQEQALAYERYALHFLHTNKAKAVDQLRKAYFCYESWGSVGKSKQLMDQYPSFFSSEFLQSNSSKLTLPIEMQLESSAQTKVSQITFGTGSSCSISLSSNPQSKKKLRIEK